MIEADRLPLIAVGALTTLVGITLLLFDFRRRAYRAFGAIAALRGLSFIAVGFVSASWPQISATLLASQPYFLLPLVPLGLYFASVFPERRGPLGFRGSGWYITGASILLAFVYFLSHRSVFSIGPAAEGRGFDYLGAGWMIEAYGPLSILIAAVPLTLALIGLLYAWEYVRNPAGHDLCGLIAAGFILNGLFDGGLAAAALLNDPSVFDLTGYALAFPILRALALIPAAIGLGMIMATSREEGHSRRLQIALPVAAALALVSGPIPILVGVSEYGLTWHSRIVLALWRLVMPVTVGYALIRSGMLHDMRLPHMWPRRTLTAVRDDGRAAKD